MCVKDRLPWNLPGVLQSQSVFSAFSLKDEVAGLIHHFGVAVGVAVGGQNP
jgi:hypothetical protein